MRMFNKHVSKLLSAYCHKELDASQADRVSAHLDACRRCSQEYEEIKLGVHFAEQLPTLTAPDTLWGEIEALLDAKPRTQAARPRASQRLFGWLPAFAYNPLAVVSAVLVVGLITALSWYYFRSVDAPWEVTSLEGTVLVDSDRVDEIGSLSVGEWLETGGSSRARISVADIGFVEVEPQTSLRLVRTRLTEHRLELKRGTVHAMIFAPPRLFFVDTPSATAVDYGCAYTLEVDDAGATFLHVTMGYVALEHKDRESMVPAGAACATRPGVGPGTPYFEDATDDLKAALVEIDFERYTPSAIETVLKEARAFDTLTLWHLVRQVGEEDRGRIYDRISALATPPEGVTREGVINLDDQVLKAWRDQLEHIWFRQDVPVWKKAWRNVWGG